MNDKILGVTFIIAGLYLTFFPKTSIHTSKSYIMGNAIMGLGDKINKGMSERIKKRQKKMEKFNIVSTVVVGILLTLFGVWLLFFE